MRLLIITLACFLSLSSCQKGAAFLKHGVSGTPYEILVVTSDSLWHTQVGESVFDMLNAGMEGFAQNESLFKISRVSPSQFSSTINIARNILLFDISERYSIPKITYQHDVWASPQVVVKLTSPTDSTFVSMINQYHSQIQDFFIRAEYSRQAHYYEKYYHKENTDIACSQFPIQIHLPANQIRVKQDEHFFWSSNMSTDIRQDILIYSFPYTDSLNFSMNGLTQKRDSVLRLHVPGPVEGSFMATDTTHISPIYRTFMLDGLFTAELRGWWRVEGDLMGGPFVSLARVNEPTQEVIVVEGFVYAPGVPKRSFIRQLEAVLYASKLTLKSSM